MTTTHLAISVFFAVGVLGCATEPTTNPSDSNAATAPQAESSKGTANSSEVKPFTPPPSARPELGTNPSREPTQAFSITQTGSGTVTDIQHTASGVSPDKALMYLKHGNERFVNKKLRADGQDLKDIKRVAPAQRPHSVVLSCSDSRVPLPIIFDQKLGEMMEVRSWGPSLDSSTIASLEQAIEFVGVKLIVVLGQSNCTGVQAALMLPPPPASSGSTHIDRVVADIRERIGMVATAARTPSAQGTSSVGTEVAQNPPVLPLPSNSNVPGTTPMGSAPAPNAPAPLPNTAGTPVVVEPQIPSNGTQMAPATTQDITLINKALPAKSTVNAPDVSKECLTNVRGIARDLVLRSEIIRRAVETGRVQVQVGFYQLENGNVRFD